MSTWVGSSPRSNSRDSSLRRCKGRSAAAVAPVGRACSLRPSDPGGLPWHPLDPGDYFKMTIP
jgi:hypothetical protein